MATGKKISELTEVSAAGLQDGFWVPLAREYDTVKASFGTLKGVLMPTQEEIAEAVAPAVDDWLTDHPEATTTVQDGAITEQKLASDVLEILDNKADIDGYYESLTAGAADNLTGRGDAVDASYLYRTTGGTADVEDGTATIKSLRGNTLVWNQLNKNESNTKEPSGVTITKNSNGSITLDGTANADGYVYPTAQIPLVSGHEYLVKGCPSGGGASTYYFGLSSNAALDTGTGGIYTSTVTSNSGNLRFIFKSGVTFDNVTIWPQVFDLTMIFGSGNEPTSVAEFEALYPLDYYPYDAGSLLPVKMQGIRTTGFNQWDEQTVIGFFTDTGQWSNATTNLSSKNPIPVLPNTTYYFGITAGNTAHVTFWKSAVPSGASAASEYIPSTWSTNRANTTFTTPPDCRYIHFNLGSSYGTTYNNDVCINLHWSGRRDGEYEEYWSNERLIPIATYFTDGMRKAGAVYDELTEGKAITRVGSVDMGDLTWIYETNNHRFASSVISDAVSSLSRTEIVCSKYAYANSGSTDKTAFLYNGFIYVYDSDYTDAVAFTAAVDGTELLYPLATPTEAAIYQPLNLSYKVSDWGTEQVMVDETAAAPQSAPPVMQVVYGINAVDTIRRLPTEYESHESFVQFYTALATALGLTVVETWDSANNRYEYSITTGEGGE